jgi:hypothetical protein
MSAHGDYNRAAEMPSPSYWSTVKLIHNYIAPFSGSTSAPDDPRLDADTSDGFPTYAERHYAEAIFGGNISIGYRYTTGSRRLLKTQADTYQAYVDLKVYIALYGGKKEDGHCGCRRAFNVSE